MILNKIESVVLCEFLRRIGREEVQACEIHKTVDVQDRSLSGSGFITDLGPSEALEVDSAGGTYKWGKLGAKLNAKIDSGYLLYIENGYLVCIEGYTYDDSWPSNISLIEPYELA